MFEVMTAARAAAAVAEAYETAGGGCGSALFKDLQQGCVRLAGQLLLQQQPGSGPQEGRSVMMFACRCEEDRIPFPLRPRPRACLPGLALRPVRLSRLSASLSPTPHALGHELSVSCDATPRHLG
jgi:hypothetical protein